MMTAQVMSIPMWQGVMPRYGWPSGVAGCGQAGARRGWPSSPRQGDISGVISMAGSPAVLVQAGPAVWRVCTHPADADLSPLVTFPQAAAACGTFSGPAVGSTLKRNVVANVQ